MRWPSRLGAPESMTISEINPSVPSSPHLTSSVGAESNVDRTSSATPDRDHGARLSTVRASSASRLQDVEDDTKYSTVSSMGNFVPDFTNNDFRWQIIFTGKSQQMDGSHLLSRSVMESCSVEHEGHT